MGNDGENFTLEEALQQIKKQFAEEGGLIYQIEKGVDINQAEVRVIENALKRLATEWASQKVIDKREARLFTSVIPRLEKCISLYPDRASEIQDLLNEVCSWIENTFISSDLSEEDAIVLLGQHIFGTPQFGIQLRFGRIDEDAFAELSDALNVLEQKWKDRKKVSKFAAYAMVSTPILLMTTSKNILKAEKQRFQEIEQYLINQIYKCLS